MIQVVPRSKSRVSEGSRAMEEGAITNIAGL